MADVSQYPVNHLVTFCLGEDDGVHTVEDASRKLAVMDSQGRVWAQEMLLRVSPDHVTLLDPASKEELESYPLGAIVRCDAVMPPGRSRSLLLLVCQEPERAQPDVHFFQGLRLGAELIREDIQGALHNYRSGRGERRAAALSDPVPGRRLELPPEEGPPYRPDFFSGWEPPVTDPQGRAWEDPVEKQLQHERRRRQQSAPQVAVNGHQDLEPESEPQLVSETAGKWVLCNYDFQARNSSELSVKQRDVLEVLDDRRKWWKVRDPAGQEGYVPYNILTPHPGPRLHHCQSPARSLNSTPPPPPAPAPAPPPALARPRWDSCDSLNSLDPSEKEKFSQMLIVNEELQARLAQGRSGPSRTVPGPRAPEPQLSPHSDASEVRAWLQAKGFSSGTVDALGVLTGAQLFSLQKEELRAVSPEEGARVYSQVTVQRALLEDKEKVSELEAVMEKQKKKVEGGMEMEVI
ncbi:PREDICTED: epidermal growth factor receptor kinase substrate 8-like protein 1 [Colobus angolensis palliatus]|uniref:epidermal growth factor receptor kinase substrate 8-like protein 1 n=1 Tax=Colobus angolensis palliatus TaxID=336983 RepID=UPI0005F3736E|nr:PREDICTED: epidermal growth factor receptor kinase substrate 8-like protein 1 [Colobus angolensis palliatus]